MGMVELISSGDVLIKGGLFVVVQALVYLILSNSSHVFSENSTLRSLSFKPPRSVSIRRMFVAISDVPSGGEASPNSSLPSSSSFRGFPFPSPTKEFSTYDDLVFN